MTAHTPLPWVIDDRFPNNVYSADDSGILVATCRAFDYTPRPNAEILANAALIIRSVNGCPDDIRVLGWRVDIHMDIHGDDQSETYWAFRKGDRYVQGRGQTDAEALNIVRAKIAEEPT